MQVLTPFQSSNKSLTLLILSQLLLLEELEQNRYQEWSKKAGAEIKFGHLSWSEIRTPSYVACEAQTVHQVAIQLLKPTSSEFGEYSDAGRVTISS